MNTPYERFLSLVGRILDGEATEVEREAFRRLLREHPELIEAYREQVDIDTLAYWKFGRKKAAAEVTGTRRSATRWKRAWWKVAAAAAAAVVAATVWQATTARRSEELASFAQATAAKGVGRLASDSRSPAIGPVVLMRGEGAVGLELPGRLPGTVRLAAGQATVRLGSGVALTLLGPLELEVLDVMSVRLGVGRLLAEVPPVASGFTVRTRELEVWDIGTVFGVSAEEGRSDVFVFKGGVQVNEASGEPVDLCEAGQGVRAVEGQRPFKFAADWPEARRFFAKVGGTTALGDPGLAFAISGKIGDIWEERYVPGVSSRLATLKPIARMEGALSVKEEGTEMRQLTKTVAAMALGAATLGPIITADAQVVVNDPLAYWSFDDVGGTLSNLVTSSPYHDATVLLGQPTSGVLDGASGIVGNALVLNGASGIRLPYHQDNLGTSFTVSLWYWQQTNDTRQCVYQSRDNWVASYEAAGANSVFASHVGQEWAGQTTTRLNEWIHLTHTFSTVGGTTTLSVYTNGVLQFTKSADASSVFEVNQLRGLHVGAYRVVAADSRCFKGMIDEVALWGRCLSAEEVQEVYQRGAGGQKLPFTAQAMPSIQLAGGQLAYLMQADGGIPNGMFNNGWLASTGVGQPGSAPETARAASVPLGSTLPDTAGHAEGPFNAEKLANMRWRVPMAAGSPLKRMPQGDFTAEAWFRTTSTGANVLFGTYPGTGAGAINLQLEVNSGAMLYWRTNSTATAERIQVTPPANLRGRDGNWHHLVGVRSGSTAYLYMDGVQIGTTNVLAGAFDLGESYLYIGQDGRQNWGLFDGEIGDARLWGRALSSNEVVALAAFGRPGGSVSRSGLLAEYAAYNPFAAMSLYPGYRIPMTPRLRQIPQTNFTYEVKFRTTDTGRGILVGNYVGESVTTNVNSLELYTDNQIRFMFRGGTSGWNSISRSTGAINTRDGAWHRIASVRRDGQVFLYLDGQQLGAGVSDTFGAYALSGTYLGLGRDFRASPTYPLNGDLAEVRVWSRALSAAELAGLAGSGDVPSEGLVAQYAPFPTNSLRTAGFPGSRFLRSYAAGTNTAVMVFSGLPKHTKIGLGLLLAQLDSLDPLAEGEGFAIKVDGAEVLSVGLGPNQGSEPQVATFKLFGSAVDVNTFKSTLTLGGQDLFGCGGTVTYNDHVYDLSLLTGLQNIPHSGGTLVLEFTGIQNMGGENEGFGVDNVHLTVHPSKGTLIRLL